MSPSHNFIHHHPKPKPSNTRRLQRRVPHHLQLAESNQQPAQESQSPRPRLRRRFSLKPLEASLHRHSRRFSRAFSIGTSTTPLPVISPVQTIAITNPPPAPPIPPRTLSPLQDDDQLSAALAASQLEYSNYQHMIHQRESELLERARRESQVSETQRLEIHSARLEQERQLIDAVLEQSREALQSPTATSEPYSPLNEDEERLSLDLALALSLHESSPNDCHNSDWPSQSSTRSSGHQPYSSGRRPSAPEPFFPRPLARQSHPTTVERSNPAIPSTHSLPHSSAYHPSSDPSLARPGTLRLPVPSYDRLQSAPDPSTNYGAHGQHPRPHSSCYRPASDAAEQPPRPVSSYTRPLPPVPPTSNQLHAGPFREYNLHSSMSGPEQPADAQDPLNTQPMFPLPEPSYILPLPEPSYNRPQATVPKPQPNPGAARMRPVSSASGLTMQRPAAPSQRPFSHNPRSASVAPSNLPTPTYLPSKPPPLPPVTASDQPADGAQQTSLPLMFPLAEPTYTQTQVAVRSRYTSTYTRRPSGSGPAPLRQRPASIDAGPPPASSPSNASSGSLGPRLPLNWSRPTVPHRPAGEYATDPFAAAVGARGRVAALVQQFSAAEDDSSAQLSSSSSCTRSDSTLSADSDVPETPQGGSLRHASTVGRVATETFGANPIAPETVLEGIRYGRVVGLADQLDNHGQFPDALALSRYVRVKTGHEKVDAAVFAIEAWSWTRLLTYLMWHGNSRIEAGPLDIAEAADEGWAGWEVSLRVMFRESLAENGVRLVIELVQQGAQPGAGVSGVESRGSANSIEGQQTVVRLPGAQTGLPIQLAALAASLHEIHTVATMASCGSRTFRVVHSAKTAHAETLVKLARAIAANAQARGEVPATAQEEAKLMQRGRKWLKSKRMAHHGTAGGKESLEVDGSGLPLPNGATLVQPWDSEWV